MYVIIIVIEYLLIDNNDMEYTILQIEEIFNTYDFSGFLFTNERLRKLGKQRKEQTKLFMDTYPGLVTCYSEIQYIYEHRDNIKDMFCPVCGKRTTFNVHNRTYRKYCSNKCKGNSEEVRQKAKDTCINKYGCENPNQNKDVLQKRIETSTERYGKGNYNNRVKAKETERKHYGGKTYFETEEYKALMENKRPEIVQKIRNTVFEKTGKEWITQTSEFKEKRISTLNEHGTAFISAGEQEIIEYVKELGYDPIKYIIGTGDTRFEIDCYIPELKIGIEFNGIYYHSRNGRNKRPIQYHYNKQLEALNKEIDLIHVWEDQWYYKKDIIKNIIKARLNKITKQIYARKCNIKELTNNEYNDFCNKYHIQGTRTASIKLGLIYDNQLIQVASFNKVRNKGRASNQNKLYDYEWVRGCTLPNLYVVGGISRLYKHFLNIYKPMTVLCYADWNLFNGKGYTRIGFKFEGYTGPDLFFVNNNLIRISRNPYKHREHMELVRQNKLYECHGCGSKKFVWYAPESTGSA